MHETPLSDVSGKWVVAAVMRDYCDVWHVTENHDREVMHLHRPDEGAEHHHVRQAQEHHGHRSDQGSTEYYKYIAAVLSSASDVILLGMAQENRALLRSLLSTSASTNQRATSW